MPPRNPADPITRRLNAINEWVYNGKRAGRYLFHILIEDQTQGGWVVVQGRRMLMMATYSYLGLIGHPRLRKAACEAAERYGTGGHGSRTLSGTLPVHLELEEAIAEFKGTEAAIAFPTGYVTNVSTIAALVGRGDYIISDKYNHASLIDGALMSGAKLLRYRHNDMDMLERRLQAVPPEAGKLIVADAVFSMDGDILDLPTVVALARKYDAWLMVDEAHSVGVLGQTGRGIEEHFNMPGVIDLKMGTLSKAIPSMGGYIAAADWIVHAIRHAARGYIFTAAMSPVVAAVALEGLRLLQEETWRVEKLQANTRRFLQGLRERGFDILQSETPVVPVMARGEDLALQLTRAVMKRDVFILPVLAPAVPQGQERLRATVTAAHDFADVDYAIEALTEAAREVGLPLKA
ncbi:MAG: aminotransferase class I/II-fold pyridoxal phosphate-dependent enzyme [Chloroflexi bacterium]|nr:aminotransferase class I/II-fold pyridoxal phosphate-dependent enzyme [Chloroflexota bacterium]